MRTMRREGHDPEGAERGEVAAIVDHVEVLEARRQRAHLARMCMTPTQGGRMILQLLQSRIADSLI